MTIAAWYERLDRELSKTDLDLVQRLNEEYPQPWCIPFFGNVTEARILTVGVNPAFSEFQNPRWKGIGSASDAVNLLLNYFNDQKTAHYWFSTWEQALNQLDASYYGTRQHLAAHVDIWPRAADTLSGLDKEQLCECIRAEFGSFKSVLDRAQNATLILMAGSLAGKYLNHFLQTWLPKELGSLELSFDSRAQRGSGKVAWHRLQMGDRMFPVFFCGNSPSDDENRHLLVDKIREFKIPINKWGKL